MPDMCSDTVETRRDVRPRDQCGAGAVAADHLEGGIGVEPGGHRVQHVEQPRIHRRHFLRRRVAQHPVQPPQRLAVIAALVEVDAIEAVAGLHPADADAPQRRLGGRAGRREARRGNAGERADAKPQGLPPTGQRRFAAGAGRRMAAQPGHQRAATSRPARASMARAWASSSR
jgi:hypothetical protein